MTIERIVFAQQIAVPGTAIRTEYFNAPEWTIEVTPHGVTLERPANPEQNIPALRRFAVVGIGYCAQQFEEKPSEEQTEEQESAAGHEEAAAADVAGSAPEDPPPTVDEVSKTRRRLRKARDVVAGK